MDAGHVFRELVDQTPHVLFVLCADGLRAEYVNAAYDRVFGRSRATLERAPHDWLGSVLEPDRARLRDRLARRRAGAAPEALGEFRIEDAQGRTRWMLGNVRELESTEGGVPRGCWVESLHDVTEARAARARESRERQLKARLVQMLGALVVETDGEGRVVWWNEAVTTLCGRALEGARRSHIMELVSPDGRDAPGFAQALAAMEGTGRYHVGVRELTGPSSAARDIDWWVAPLRDDDGDIQGFLGLGHDVTEERRTARALHASKDLVRSMSEAMEDVFFVAETDRSKLHYVNPAIERMWGITVEELTANPALFLERIHPDDAPDVARRIADDRDRLAATSLIESEYRIVHPDGTVRWIDSRTYPIKTDDGHLRTAGLLRDITERREAERALARREELLRQMSEAMQEAFFLVSVDRTKIHYVNPAFEAMWGLSGEAVKANPALLSASIHPEDRERIASEIAAARARGDHQREQNQELRVVRPDGSTRWIHARTYPVVEADGRVDRLVGLYTDITERKTFEHALRERTAQLELSLREKDILLAEVHHRVKNNLQAITGLIHLVAAQAHRRPLRETIEELERRIMAMALVHETLYRSTSLAAVDMQGYLERIVDAVVSAGDLGQRAVSVEVRANATMDLDRAMRCGIIVNELVNNAVKHAFTGRARGRIEVELRSHAGSGCALRVSDDGRGLPPDLDLGSEETLGLRLVSGLSQQMGGTVRRVPGERSAIEIVFVGEG